MIFTQHFLKALNISAIEASLKPNEKIVSTNAIVIADDTGEITGWFDGDSTVCFIQTEET